MEFKAQLTAELSLAVITIRGTGADCRFIIFGG